MEITTTLFRELQKKLKIGNRRGVHLNAIPNRSRYKLDFNNLGQIDETYPKDFIQKLLTTPDLDFKYSIPFTNNTSKKGNQLQQFYLYNKIANLINQTKTIELEKGINTFGFGFPLLIRKDLKDGKITVAPILIWSLKIQYDNGINSFRISRTADDPIYLNEVLINHIESDSQVKIEAIPEEMLADDLINESELNAICIHLLNTLGANKKEIRDFDILNQIKPISDRKDYEQQLKHRSDSKIEFGGLFSIFEVQKQSIINDYDDLINNLPSISLALSNQLNTNFQAISSVQTDPSQQGILNALKSTNHILIQGPPGTGKSQTLTAILVNALENHKRVIVI